MPQALDFNELPLSRCSFHMVPGLIAIVVFVIPHAASDYPFHFAFGMGAVHYDFSAPLHGAIPQSM